MSITAVKLLLINSMAGSFMMPQRITVFITFLTNITIQGLSSLLMRVLNMSPAVMLSYSKCFSTKSTSEAQAIRIINNIVINTFSGS